ncbi:MAG TPA: FadR/GntR family transcriptional regulator [Phototrophicaceae bacterium]|nr:FadR/GntR family transcriptional regulator [Phototrophicaceae bacterium]
MKKLKPLDTVARYRAVQEELRSYIIDNQMRPGDRLPSETTLAERLGVSRNVVREAIKGLEAQGLVEVRVGLGIFVKAADLDDFLINFAYSLLFDGNSVVELYEIRQRLELSYIREAVRQLSDANLSEMEHLLAEMEAQYREGQDFILQDLALHRTLFDGVGNATLLKLFDIFGTIYAGSRHLFSAQPPDVIADDLNNHKLLLAALRARDEDLAVQRLQATYTPLPDLVAQPERTPTT